MSLTEIHDARISMKTLHHRFLIALADIKAGVDVREGDAIDAMLTVAITYAARVHGHEETIGLLRAAADQLVCAETAIEIRRAMN